MTVERVGKARRDETTPPQAKVTLAEMYRRDTARWDCLAVRACRLADVQRVAPWRWEGCRPAAAKIVGFFGRGRFRLHTSLTLARAVSVVRAGRCRSTRSSAADRWTLASWFLPEGEEEDRRRGIGVSAVDAGADVWLSCPAHSHAVPRDSEPNSGNTQHRRCGWPSESPVIKWAGRGNFEASVWAGGSWQQGSRIETGQLWGRCMPMGVRGHGYYSRLQEGVGS